MLLPGQPCPRYYVSFPQIPALQSWLLHVVRWILRDFKSATCLFTWRFRGKPSSKAITELFGRLLLGAGAKVSPTSHCAHVGCCSALLRLGMTELAVKAHVGWTPSSESWAYYLRPGLQLAPYDEHFYFAALPVTAQRLLEFA